MAGPTGPQVGYNAKIRVNGQVYSGAEWSWQEEADDVEVTNCEGQPGNPAASPSVGSKAHLGGPAGVRVSIKQATFNASENPYQAPRVLSVQAYASVQIYPAGTTGVRFNAPNLLILQSNYNGTAKGAQPLEFTGVTDGFYTDAST